MTKQQNQEPYFLLSSSVGGSLLAGNLSVQIIPMRIDCFYELFFFSTQKVFELFLTRKCTIDIPCMFIVYELVALVLLGKAFERSLSMFLHSANQVIGHPNVESS